MTMEEKAGTVIHFYDKISVAVVRLDEDLRRGDVIRVAAKTGDFEQKIASMQVNHAVVDAGKKGEEVAIEMAGKVSEGDMVYKKK